MDQTGPAARQEGEEQYVDALSCLLLNSPRRHAVAQRVLGLNAQQRAQLLEIADLHHVVIRALQVMEETVASAEQGQSAEWIATVLARERARGIKAIEFLAALCRVVEEAAGPLTVIKTIEHWPDLGHDFDLYTTADSEPVLKVLVERFGAKIKPRSWRSQLRDVWTLVVPGVVESVEIYFKRFGYIGEQTTLAQRFVDRRVSSRIGGHMFQLPAPEERVIVAAVCRLYNSFSLRLSDVVNTARLIESKSIDYAELRAAAELGGIWSGVATYLANVSDYVQRYRGTALDLPSDVFSSAKFRGDKIFVDQLLRIPVFPQAIRLYMSLFTTAHGDVSGTLRLSLMPVWAATAILVDALKKCSARKRRLRSLRMSLLGPGTYSKL